jgi:hypothetical protein
MTIRREEFDVLAAEVSSGRLTENEVVRWMEATGWPGHSAVECWQWWQAEYSARRAEADRTADDPVAAPSPEAEP